MIGVRSRSAVLAISAAVIGVTLVACGSQSSTTASPSSASSPASANPTSAAAPIDVVASSNVWGDITKQVGAERVAVTSILSDPNADPHEYESDAKTAAAVSKGQLVVENGLGYDDFMDKLLSASPNPNRKVLTASDVMHISGSDANPHIWYDIAKIADVASAIATQLGALDPADAATFTANAKTFDDSLAPINSAIDNIKSKYPGAQVGYTERVPGYLVQAAGLQLATPASFAQSIEDGNDPSVADNAAMDAALASPRSVAVKGSYAAPVTGPALTRGACDLQPA